MCNAIMRISSFTAESLVTPTGLEMVIIYFHFRGLCSNCEPTAVNV
jgi:hypothetical protein